MESFGEGMNSGHYFPLTLDSKYEGQEITCKGTVTKKASDLDWLLYVASNESKFVFSTEEDGDFLTLTFQGAELAQNSVTIFMDTSSPLTSVTAAKATTSTTAATTAKKRGRPAKTATTTATE